MHFLSRQATQAQRERHILEYRQVWEERVVLEDKADLPFVGRQSRDVGSADEDFPDRGRSNPEMMRRSVVLPEPLGPSRVTNSPGGTSSETPFSATKAPKLCQTSAARTSTARGW